jgi:hypothetical protein
MTITLAQLHTSMVLLNKMFEAKLDRETAKTAFRLSRTIKSARDEAQLLSEAQLKLLQDNGTPVNGNDGQWEIEELKREEFASAWNGLLTTEVELWGKKFEAEELDGLFKRLEFTVAEIGRLEWMVDLGEE